MTQGGSILVRPLVERLAHWRGRRALQSALEAQDFQSPRLYQDFLLQGCPTDQKCLIEEYWDEVALELVSALGYVRPDSREWQDRQLVEQAIVPPTPYRSVLLDDLNDRAHFRKPPFLKHSLIECIYIHQVNDNLAILQGRNAIWEAWKAEEYRRHAHSLPDWNGVKKDAVPIVEAIAVPLGFKRKGRTFHYEHSTGLILEVGFDLGGFKETTSVDFIRTSVYHRDDKALRFGDVKVFPYGDCSYHLQRMVPGLSLYRHSSIVQYNVLGMQAGIAALLAFADTIG